MAKTQKSITIPLPQGNTSQYILVGLLIVASFLLGTLYTKVQYLEKSPKADVGENVAGVQDPGVVEEKVLETPKLSKDDHVKGNQNARYVLIEYSDFECPFCTRFHETAKKALEEYDDLKWVYRHFPLAFHPNAMPSAIASECANELGGNDMFWEYTDVLFEKSETGGGDALTKDNLIAYAQQLGLDTNKFTACIESGKYEQEINDEMASGTRAGVEGTPGNILLDTKTQETQLIPGAVPFEQLKTVLDEMMGK